MNRLFFEKINQLYTQLLNRNLIQKELLFYNQQIKLKQFSFQNVIQIILQSNEFTKKSLENLKKIFNALEINIETIPQTKIIFYLEKLKKGYSLLNLTSDIINEYKKTKTKTKNNEIDVNDLPNNEKTNVIKNTFQKILERLPTNKELIKYKHFSENALENTLLHTIECSNLIDKHLQKMVENVTFDISK